MVTVPGTEPQLRRASTDDAAIITSLVRESYHHYISRMGKEPGPMLEDYVRAIEVDGVWVAECGPEIVGVLVMKISQGRCLMDNVAVHPDWQGRGISRLLIDHAEQYTGEQGFEELQLYTHECMTESYSLYLALGFSEIDRREELGYQRIYMAKQVAMPA